MEDVIAAQVDRAVRPGAGRRLMSASELLHLSFAHGKSVDFVNGGLDSKQESAEDNVRTYFGSVSR